MSDCSGLAIMPTPYLQGRLEKWISGIFGFSDLLSRWWIPHIRGFICLLRKWMSTIYQSTYNPRRGEIVSACHGLFQSLRRILTSLAWVFAVSCNQLLFKVSRCSLISWFGLGSLTTASCGKEQVPKEKVVLSRRWGKGKKAIVWWKELMIIARPPELSPGCTAC